jgi:hypothetical protein
VSRHAIPGSDSPPARPTCSRVLPSSRAGLASGRAKALRYVRAEALRYVRAEALRYVKGIPSTSLDNSSSAGLQACL